MAKSTNQRQNFTTNERGEKKICGRKNGYRLTGTRRCRRNTCRSTGSDPFLSLAPVILRNSICHRRRQFDDRVIGLFHAKKYLISSPRKAQ
jgi:hypothetical protein